MMTISSTSRNLIIVAALAVTANGFVAPRPATSFVGSSSLSAGPFDALTDMFAPKQVESASEPVVPALPPVVVDPSFKLAGIFLGLGLVLDTIPIIKWTLGLFVTLLGVLFFVQTFRIRFVFDDTAFELRQGDELEDPGENFVVGGENRWSYDSFVNWEFFPEGWVDQPQGPILAYFKETQTPSDKWNEGPGESANSAEAIAKGAVPGQVHFFPVLCDAQQLRDEFQKRQCAKL